MKNRAHAIILCLAASAVADEGLHSASKYVSRGMQLIRDNKIRDSISNFNRAVELDPQIKPRLWQLGISHYYAGHFKNGRKQFELHQTVNPHDVENAAWHFICVAQIDGIESARETLIKIDTSHDTRVPMAEEYRFYAGRGSNASVIRAAEDANTEIARMYAHLYLGLYWEVAGRIDEAREHMRKAAASKLDNHYMHDVAKVHLMQRNWNR